jgi:hypothetical protein
MLQGQDGERPTDSVLTLQSVAGPAGRQGGAAAVGGVEHYGAHGAAIPAEVCCVIMEQEVGPGQRGQGRIRAEGRFVTFRSKFGNQL